MTASELSLFSTVTYQGTPAVIIKIKDGNALLYDATSGWFSFLISASQLSLVSRYTAPSGTPSNVKTAPLWSNVIVNGKQGYLIDKRVTPNQWTGEDYVVALVWFMDTETVEWFEDSQISFTAPGIPPYLAPGIPPYLAPGIPPYLAPGIPPYLAPTPDVITPPETKMSTTNWLLYAAIAVGAYLLMKEKKT